MTDDPRTICKRCGFANIPGDQFCGSCGAFLEWEGKPAGRRGRTREPATAARPRPGTPPTPPRRARPEARRGARRTATRSRHPCRPAAPEPDTYDEDGDGIPDGPLVRCPACGIANPSNRTFCQSCGTTLAAADRVVGAAARAGRRGGRLDVHAAAVAGGRRHEARARVLGRARHPGLGARRGRGRRARRRRDRARGARPARQPAGDRAQPSGAAPSGAAEQRGARGQRVGPRPGRPGRRGPLTLTGATASVGAGDLPRFAAGEGHRRRPQDELAGGQGAGEEPVDRGGLRSRARRHARHPQRQPGLGRRQYQGQSPAQGHPGQVGGKAIPFRLKDTMKAQQIDLGGVTGATSVRITIVSTYAGRRRPPRQNTPFGRRRR